MLSLGFPIPLQNSLSPLQYKPFPSSINAIDCSRRNNSNSYPLSVSLSKSNNKVSRSASSGEERERVVMNEEDLEAAGLRSELMPKHVAVIMDGNRRWAAERGLPPMLGHHAGHQALKKLIRLYGKWGVNVLTVFAFSTENWTRPKEEVDGLMVFFEETLISELEEMTRMGVRLNMIGNKSMLPKSLQDKIEHIEHATMANSRIQVNFAINYSGRFDITQACKAIANKAKNGLILPADIDENLVQEELETKYVEPPFPDLLIRTSGELRISNFMLWQLAYSEFVFIEKLFPDFEEADLLEALRSFQKRKR